MILRYYCQLSRHLYTKAPSQSRTPYPSRLELDTVNLHLRTEFPVFWEFLGIPKNSQKFPSMQISSDFKSLELLGISGKGRLQFCEDLEFLGILSYTNYLRRVEFLGTSGNWTWGNLNTLKSKSIPRNSHYLECEGFKTRSNFRGLYETLA